MYSTKVKKKNPPNVNRIPYARGMLVSLIPTKNEIVAITKNMVMGILICVLEILSRIGLENICADPKLFGFSNLPIFFISSFITI